MILHARCIILWITSQLYVHHVICHMTHQFIGKLLLEDLFVMYVYGRVDQVASGLREEEKNCLFEKEKIVCLLFTDDSCSRTSARRSKGRSNLMGLQLQ